MLASQKTFYLRLIRGAKEKAKQTRQTKSTCRDKFLSRLTVPRRGKEGRSRPLVVQSSRNVDAGVDATGKRNLLPLTSQSSLTLSHEWSLRATDLPRKCIHTRALEPISGFEIRETRVRWGASRRRVPTEAVVFPSGSTESRGGGGRPTVPTPPPFPYPRLPLLARTRSHVVRNRRPVDARHSPRVRIHFNVELLSRIFFADALRVVAGLFPSLSSFLE